jgi:hypothetical protein
MTYLTHLTLSLLLGLNPYRAAVASQLSDLSHVICINFTICMSPLSVTRTNSDQQKSM